MHVLCLSNDAIGCTEEGEGRDKVCRAEDAKGELQTAVTYISIRFV